MEDRRKLYNILEKMIDAAGRRNTGEVRKLNQQFRAIEAEIPDFLTNRDYTEYDHCRASCTAALTLLKNEAKSCILDAKQKLATIKEREGYK